MQGILSDRSRVTITPDQVSADLSGETVVLHLSSGVYYGLDPVAARVWELLQEPRSVGEIRDALVEEYDVDAARCERDLIGLLQTLAAAELIEICGEPGA
jgi:hypothetical protein